MKRGESVVASQDLVNKGVASEKGRAAHLQSNDMTQIFYVSVVRVKMPGVMQRSQRSWL